MKPIPRISLLSFSSLVIGAALACTELPRHSAEGIVRGVDHDAGQILIDHREIEGLMGAMTMSFDVAQPELLEGLQTGHAIEFVVVQDGDVYRVEEIVVTGSAYGEAGGDAFAGLPREGDLAPGFQLIDQDGRSLSLDELRGHAVFLDFIFTHCPGPCPILTAKHVALQRMLSPDQRRHTRFVSISLDPERDTPEALRAYATAHGADIAHWSFLTGEAAAVNAVLRSYGVRGRRVDGGEIDHVVATFLIDGEGRIRKRYLGLEHGRDALHTDLGLLAPD